jgi:hypothetical protein
MKKLLYIVLLMLSLSVAVQALDDQGNPNDPTINERANACYEDGSMAGKCDTQWEWEAGWYLIRFEYGLISREDFPAQYAILLPPLPVEEAAATEEPVSYPTTGCVFTALGGIVMLYADFSGGNFLSSPVNFYDNSDCSGSADPSTVNLVYAPNGAADAQAICENHGFDATTTHPGFPLAPNIYACLSI